MLDVCSMGIYVLFVLAPRVQQYEDGELCATAVWRLLYHPTAREILDLWVQYLEGTTISRYRALRRYGTSSPPFAHRIHCNVQQFSASAGPENLQIFHNILFEEPPREWPFGCLLGVELARCNWIFFCFLHFEICTRHLVDVALFGQEC